MINTILLDAALFKTAFENGQKINLGQTSTEDKSETKDAEDDEEKEEEEEEKKEVEAAEEKSETTEEEKKD